ncbi:methyl-accepting chemotaxis protein [Noviherbaspirillum sp. CPCC 100848]|uniref:Methyl-accepting chemotaxis protein n=1 Tax=Noviherbaspirillum album TaxID=3080276 RepID=A0ABU6JGZ9_9BURK|nr:methyl-accepting chemotaxis protein [Noviherbaspirillum sp. CPCC 100848]MEC4722472.1 methyl-accepting chemotaxis protein [Noviherbaspirillum sp. CPCC 100848]
MFKNLTIKTRLIGVIAFLSLQLIIGGVIGIASLSNANSSMRSIYDDRLVTLGQLDRIIRYINEDNSAVAKALTGEQSGVEQALKEIGERSKLVEKEWEAYMRTKLTPEEKKAADEFAAARKVYMAEGLKAATDSLQVLDTQSGVAALHGPMSKLFTPMRDKIDHLIKLQLDIAKAEYEHSQTIYQWVRNSCIAGILFGVVLAALVGWWLVQAITRPLNVAVKVAASVADGDLTQKIDVRSNDETGQLMRALKNMNDSLVQIVSQVRTSTETIGNASTEIAAGNQDLSARTEQQASSLEETASSLEELTSTVRQNADNARQADQLAQSASEVANRGGTVVSQVVETMGSINESSKKISDIISVIDGIAFQTNILALNAAVEAARAGEQGRGFAVVASEVRSLAQRSAAAAKEIKLLIDDSVQKVDAGSRLVGQAGSTMDEIVQSIQRVTDIMGEITAATQEQTAGLDQINQAVSQMDQVTQQNAALVEEAAAAAESMREQAGGLAHAVGVFKLDGMHAAASTPATRPGLAVHAAAPVAKPATGSAVVTRSTAPVRAKAPAPKISAADGWEEF